MLQHLFQNRTMPHHLLKPTATVLTATTFVGPTGAPLLSSKLHHLRLLRQARSFSGDGDGEARCSVPFSTCSTGAAGRRVHIRFNGSNGVVGGDLWYSKRKRLDFRVNLFSKNDKQLVWDKDRRSKSRFPLGLRGLNNLGAISCCV